MFVFAHLGQSELFQSKIFWYLPCLFWYSKWHHLILTLLIQRAINDESDFLDDSAGSDLEDDKSDSRSDSSSPSEVSAVFDLSGDDRKTRSKKKKKEGDSDDSDSDSGKQ